MKLCEINCFSINNSKLILYYSMIKELSIVIPALNEEKYLPKLLNSIASQNFQGKLQVIVVDGHSQDHTVSEARKFHTQLQDLQILQVHRGLPYQRNRGAEKAIYTYLLFLDADIVLPHNFLNTLSQKTPRSEKFVGFVFHLPLKFNLLDYLFIVIAFTFISLARLFGDPLNGGSFIFTTKRNHESINGFKEGVIIGEDIDYLRRSRKNGAAFHLYYHPYVFASPRRLRKEGRMKLLLLWGRCYLHIKKHGPIYSEEKFKYPYGHYSDEV